MAKAISIFGATGSIGQSAADVIAANDGSFDVQVLSAHTNWHDLADMAERLKARHVVLVDETHMDDLKARLSGTSIQCHFGAQALLDMAEQSVDVFLAAIVGVAGLPSLMKAIPKAKVVAIANKEPLVCAGHFVVDLARKHQTTLLPIDSEHNAIFQVFDPSQRNAIERIILTASGGPFLRADYETRLKATPEQAVAHPTWSMGAKISVDSATMMNKALEVIEAHVLFDLPPKKIEVLIHPQSIVHGLVEYHDGSLLAQMGASDMRTPIANVLAWPERLATPGQKLDPLKMSGMRFEVADYDHFPALPLAYNVLSSGQAKMLAFNTANEVAVDAFLKKKIGFLDIVNVVEDICAQDFKVTCQAIDDVFSLDALVRRETGRYINTSFSLGAA